MNLQKTLYILKKKIPQLDQIIFQLEPKMENILSNLIMKKEKDVSINYLNMVEKNLESPPKKKLMISECKN